MATETTTAFAKDSAIPLNFQLKTWILSQIEQGSFKPGDKIPSEQELVDSFRVSRGTVRQALRELIDSGHLYLVRGRGTFIAQPAQPKWSVDTLVSVTEALKQQGLALRTQILELSHKNADAWVATRLKLEPNEPILILKRLRFVAGKPTLIATSWLSYELTKRLYEVDLASQSLYTALEEVCGIRISRVTRRISARLSDEAEAALLELPIPSAVLLLEGIAYDTAGNSVECSQTVFRCDQNWFELQSQTGVRDHAASATGGRP